VRDAPGRDPIRVVFDSQLRLPTTSKLAATARRTRTIVLGVQAAPRDREEALVASGVEVLRVGHTATGQLALASALTALAAASVPSILVEGGAAVAGALLAGQLVDELHVFIAPILLGPEGRPCAVAWSGPARPSEAPRIVDPIVETCGPDVYVRGRLEYPSAATVP
jgi:diaminohydroxyphosphoribosylaminopyrimidine deaminase/5-amino-6-(5-phosphoribosylamino)uracil reductase